MTAAYRLLIVDDEATVRNSLAAFLEDYGHQITTAPSAEDALVLIDNQPFDVAIVDLRLPALTGDAMIPRAHLLQPKLRFLIHTGSVDFQITEELRDLGMEDDHVLSKPVPDMTRFLTLIQSLMEQPCP